MVASSGRRRGRQEYGEGEGKRAFYGQGEGKRTKKLVSITFYGQGEQKRGLYGRIEGRRALYGRGEYMAIRWVYKHNWKRRVGEKREK